MDTPILHNLHCWQFGEENILTSVIENEAYTYQE